MATYYVRPDGNNSNAGTGPGQTQAWATIQKALGATGIASGDTVYIAPGRYNEFITVSMTSATATTYIIGDVGATQFPGVTAGVIRITSHTSDTVNATATGLITATSKNYLYWQNIYFETANNVNNPIAQCRYWTFDRCAFVCAGLSNGGNFFTNAAGVPLDLTITKCVFNCAYAVWVRTTRHSSAYDIGVSISDCLCIGVNSSFQPFLYLDATGSGSDGNGIKVYNCTMIGTGFFSSVTNTTHPMLINNVVAIATTTFFQGSNSGASTLTNCRYPNSSVSNVTVVNSSSTGVLGVDFSYSFISSLSALAIGAPYTNSILLAGGITSGAPSTDIYNRTWASGVDIGAFSNTNFSNTSFYYPTERNASAITVAPGSTSQSVELFLGNTGLTFSTSGLAAYYVRNQSAPVAITLVTQTPTGAWSSGGFAEISSSLVPGVYRLDVPNAAFAAGASDVTIVVRGASGTNGAVLTVNLIAAPTDAVLVRMGPFEVKADGLGASDPLDIQKGAQHGIDIQCVDNNGSGIDITSATVTAKVYNSGATLVDTYSCTATYAADGRATFTIDTTVTNTPGTYTATITRTTGASDTQVFGPLRIYVRDI